MSLTDILTALTGDPEGGYSVEVPAEWHQGRTLYGGCNAALAEHAAQVCFGDLGPVRALQIAFIAPAAGRLRYVPTILRQGRSVTFVGVDCLAGADLCARSILTYGRERETEPLPAGLTAPEVPAPETCKPVRLVPGVTPAFLEHMDLRNAAGSRLMSGEEPYFARWVRHRDASALSPVSAAVAIADVLPPAVMASRREFRPASSVTWTVDFAHPLPDPAGWYLLETRSDHVADGYSLQGMSCFGADGRLAAVSRQTVAIF